MLFNMVEAKIGAEGPVRKLTPAESKMTASRLIESFKESLSSVAEFAAGEETRKLLDSNNLFGPISFQRGQDTFSFEYCKVDPENGTLHFSLNVTPSIGDNKMQETIILSVTKQSEVGGSVGYWRKFPNSVADVDYDTKNAIRGAEGVLARLKSKPAIASFT